jgi:hypothetical protein
MSEKLEQMIKKFLEGPEPPPKPRPPEPEAGVIQLDPWGPRRPWRAEPPAASNALPYEPTDLDRLVETQRRVAAAARADRQRRDPWGLGLYGEYETIDDLVRRQNGDD